MQEIRLDFFIYFVINICISIQDIHVLITDRCLSHFSTIITIQFSQSSKFIDIGMQHGPVSIHIGNSLQGIYHTILRRILYPIGLGSSNSPATDRKSFFILVIEMSTKSFCILRSLDIEQDSSKIQSGHAVAR